MFFFSYIKLSTLIVIMSQSPDGEVEATDGSDPGGVVVFILEVREDVEHPVVRQDCGASEGKQVINNLENFKDFYFISLHTETYIEFIHN